MRVVTFKVDEDLFERLDGFARLKGVSRSEIIRKAVELYLRLEEQNSAAPRPRFVRIPSDFSISGTIRGIPERF